MTHFSLKKPAWVAFALIFATLCTSSQDANAGWVSCKTKNKMLKPIAIGGWVGGFVGICGEGAVMMAGGSVGETIATGLAGVACVCAAGYAGNRGSIITQEAVMDVNSLEFAGLAQLVQTQVANQPENNEIWNALQSLDAEGQICSWAGKYYERDAVATLVADRLKSGNLDVAVEIDTASSEETSETSEDISLQQKIDSTTE